MASKNQTPDDLLAQLDDLSTQPKPRAIRPVTARAPRSNHGNTSQTEQDLLAELGNLAQRPSSRPGTPSLRANQRSAAANQSPKRTSTATPPLTAGVRTSEDKDQRKSGDSTRSSHQAFTPATTTADESPAEEQSTATSASQQSSGGGWGGWFSSMASAAVNTAQARVKDLQQQTTERGLPDTQKLTEQLKGNVGLLRQYGLSGETIGSLKNMGMGTFQNILQTIAPPISSHERLMIYITHDLHGYPSLEPTIYRVFERVMSQVEGGDLMVVQRGEEAGPKRSSRELGSRIGVMSLRGAWQDGPWWRSSGERRSTNAVGGLAEGTKLARVSAEGYAADFFAQKGGVEEAARKATETLSGSNPTRDSQIFLAIQAITRERQAELFQGGSSEEKDEKKDTAGDEFLFAIYLHDPIHGIAFHAVSQAVPMQWIDWLDAPNDVEGALPDSIREIIENGGVDPREWVSEWLEETLSLATGVVAQRYVARRMGVGEVAKGKSRLKEAMNTAQMVESGGGEAARAMGGM
ncbi:hypothetical protein H2198_006609 [Neophaeococcomyces mojaviensis]|uniref:Uncharacterized protein n=1 Tax=Neophaeococcomyces mojaviensis TaxID=3383035 RepID=A0ACC3A2G1_9EURO|nr:hypothetical protein H2198_006609 [Knufia sp. JES_112]